ncbi:MAG: hypothetical protein ACREOO_00875 [bacterium]
MRGSGCVARGIFLDLIRRVCLNRLQNTSFAAKVKLGLYRFQEGDVMVLFEAEANLAHVEKMQGA